MADFVKGEKRAGMAGQAGHHALESSLAAGAPEIFCRSRVVAHLYYLLPTYSIFNMVNLRLARFPLNGNYIDPPGTIQSGAFLEIGLG